MEEHNIYTYIIDIIIVETIFKLNRELQIGNLMNVSEILEQQSEPLPEQIENDIFGLESNTNAKRQVECTCTCFVCNRIIAASRFAPHLEKCIGHGRSTRSRTRRKVDGIDPTKFIINHDGTARPIRYLGRNKVVHSSKIELGSFHTQVNHASHQKTDRPKRHIANTTYNIQR